MSPGIPVVVLICAGGRSLAAEVEDVQYVCHVPVCLCECVSSLVKTCTVLSRCYAPPPSPISWQTSCTGLFYFHYTPPPQWATRAGLRYCSSYTCCACRKWLENRYRPFSLISNGFLMPVILHVILPCSLRPVGRVWLRDYYIPAVFCRK